VPVVKMLRSGQLTIPAELRHALGLEEGADVLISLDGQGGLHLRPLPAVLPLEDLMGSLKPDRPVDLDAARRDAREDAADRFADEAARAAIEQESGPREQAAAHAG